MAQRLDFDPHLPWLGLVIDRPELARRFARWWPNPRPEHVTILRTHDVKYQPGVRCVAAYGLRAQTGRLTTTSIGVVQTTSAGVQLRLYDDDPALPHVREASTAHHIMARVASLPGFEEVKTVAVTPVRYKPESRCVFRFDIETSRRSVVLYGKMLVEGAGHLVQVVKALGAGARAIPGAPRISESLAHWSDLEMIVQAAVEDGVEFHQLVFDETLPVGDRADRMAEAGRAIAHLNTMSGLPGPLRRHVDDMSELQSLAPAVSLADPGLGAAYEEAVALLGLAEWAEDDTPVPSHGALRTDQFLVDRLGLVMVDLDTFCWADPSRDLGNFLAYLTWRAIRHPDQGSFIDRAEKRFLAGYAEVRTPPENRQIELCTAQSLLKIAGRRFRSLTTAEWPLVPRLILRARQLVTR